MWRPILGDHHAPLPKSSIMLSVCCLTTLPPLLLPLQGSAIDTLLAVYYADPARFPSSLAAGEGQPELVAANDDCGGGDGSGGGFSCVKVYVEAGAACAVQISGFGGARGDVALRISAVAAPSSQL